MRADGLGFQCEYCGTVVVPHPGDDGVKILDDAGLQCPVCDAALKNALKAGFAIEYCPGCHGILVSMDSFQALAAALRVEQGGATVAPSGDSHQLGRQIECPRCHRPMDAHFYAGPGHVVMDSCENCMVNWLDAGEMERIAHAVSSFA